MQARFFGWRVVWAAFIVAVFGWGFGFYGPPIFLHAVIERTGWPLTLVSSAVTLHFLSGVLVIANSARLYQRFGLPTVTLTGAFGVAIGTTGWALAMEPYQLFVAAVLTGAGWVTMGAVALNAMVSPWFEKKRPAALSLAYNGSSIGGVLFSPLWVSLIASLGFAFAGLILGATMMAVVVILCRLYLSKTPESLGLLPAGAQHRETNGNDTEAKTPGTTSYITIQRSCVSISRRRHGLRSLRPNRPHRAFVRRAGRTAWGASIGLAHERRDVERLDRTDSDRVLDARMFEPPLRRQSQLRYSNARRRPADPCRKQQRDSPCHRGSAVRVWNRQRDLTAATHRATGISKCADPARRFAHRRRRSNNLCLRARDFCHGSSTNA